MPPVQVQLTFRKEGTVIFQQTVASGEYIVGREGAHLVLQDEAISPQHARLTVTSHELYLEDLGSAAGTFVGEYRLQRSQRLYPRQRVRFGSEIEMEARPLSTPSVGEETLMPSTAMLQRLLPPERLTSSRYEVGHEIARGGMGTILAAQERSFGRTVAMKMMRTVSSEEQMARFIEEAQVTGQLEHPNIVPVHELGVDEHEQLFYTMKYVRGVTLQEVLAGLACGEQETLQAYPLTALLNVLQKICDAVAFAHSRQVLHRDLKPENVMLGDYGEVLVMDWGLTKLVPREPETASTAALPGSPRAIFSVRRQEHPATTLDGTVVGTPQFMSPEQARGETDSLDVRTDIYALGAILFTILHLHPPVTGDSAAEVLENVRAGRLLFPERGSAISGKPPAGGRAHLPGRRVPASLVAVARKAMSLSREERYGSVGELQKEITAYQSGYATEAEEATPLKQLALAVGRYRREAFLLAIFLVVLLAAGTYSLLRLARERNVATAERQRAEQALRDLQGTAPALAEQARNLAGQERFPEALQKLEYALQLQPGTPEYLLQKGDYLEAETRVAEAEAAYRAAIVAGEKSGRSEREARHCAEVQKLPAASGQLSRSALARLMEGMLQEGHPATEVMPIARRLGEEAQIALPWWRERLRALPIPPARPLAQRLTARADGLLSLDLSGTAVTNLQLLAGMPVGDLDLRGCRGIESLAPLIGAPLQRLDLEGTGITDLRPLRDSPLVTLSLKGTAVSDLSPLAALPLQTLDCTHAPVVEGAPLARLPLHHLVLTGTPVRDLAFLSSLPLQTLWLDGCQEARGFKALGNLSQLEVLVLPENFFQHTAEDLGAVLALKAHPRLRQIAATSPGASRAIAAKTAFWEEWGAALPWLHALAKTGVRAQIQRFADATWELLLRDQPLHDVEFLRGARLSRLDLFNVPVRDLRPLADMPLRYLDLRLTPATDLSPLQGMPLENLLLWHNQVEDFSFLQSLTSLEMLDLSETNFSDLRLLASRRLKMIRLGKTRVTDLAPLAGLPLERIHFDSVEVPDASPLLQCPELRWIVLPRSVRNPEVLKAHPKLQRLSYSWLEDSQPSQTVEEFWRDSGKTH